MVSGRNTGQHYSLNKEVALWSGQVPLPSPCVLKKPALLEALRFSFLTI